MTKLQNQNEASRPPLTCFIILCSILIGCLFTTTFAFAKDYTFGWSANPEPVEGYKLYYKKGGNAGPPFDGTDSLSGPSPIDIGKQTTFTISGLEDNTTYHFALTAYNGSDESDFTSAITVFPQSGSSSSPVTTGSKEFIFSWDPSQETGITAHRFYINDQFLCESTNPAESSLTCKGDLLNGTMHFSMTAVDSQGTESAKTNILTYEPPPPTNAFIFNWEDSSGSDVTAHRFYLNDQFLCQSTNTAETSLTCYADLLNDVMSFSMTTVDSLGNESPKSNILTFSPSEQTAPFTPSALLTWGNPANTAVVGYKIYQNGTLIGEITDPSVHEYTTDTPLTSTNVFEVTAYDSNGSETKLTSTISYTSDPTSSSSGSLAAVIISNSQTGEAPLTINFDAGASTGPISSYTWSFGDGASATGVTASHSYQSAGTYTATLTVKDTNGQSQQTALAIAVTSPPVSDSGPKAVISSSTAVGDAPFTVSFDGSGSTTSQPPITSYMWDFGDGATGEGVTVDHLYTVPGTYTSGLTVRDSAGRTDQITTPVIITLGSGQTNLPPKSSFTVAPPYGAAPLAVTFDGSASSDADGSIISYLWNFGDGTTSTGVSAQHTFTGIANYTVTLQVTDDKGVSAVSSQTVSVNTTDTPPFNFELQEVQVDNNWTRFNFTQPFVDPVVVAGPPSFNGSDPATIRIRNIDSTGCEVRIQEWEYLDDVHAQETLSFIVMERGKYHLGKWQ